MIDVTLPRLCIPRLHVVCGQTDLWTKPILIRSGNLTTCLRFHSCIHVLRTITNGCIHQRLISQIITNIRQRLVDKWCTVDDQAKKTEHLIPMGIILPGVLKH